MMNSGRRCAPCPLQATDLVPGSILRKDAELHRTDRKILCKKIIAWVGDSFMEELGGT